MRESLIEQHLVDCVKDLGGEVRKVQWIGRRGAPDRLVMLPQVCCNAQGKPAVGSMHVAWVRPARTIWVELKATGVKPEDYQLREHARMRAMGQHVVVIDSIEGVEELLS